MKIKAIKTTISKLKAGDLFSFLDKRYWNNYPSNSAGEKVYIKTKAPFLDADAKDSVIYKIKITK